LSSDDSGFPRRGGLLLNINIGFGFGLGLRFAFGLRFEFEFEVGFGDDLDREQYQWFPNGRQSFGPGDLREVAGPLPGRDTLSFAVCRRSGVSGHGDVGNE